jgi:hypothetical protein
MAKSESKSESESKRMVVPFRIFFEDFHGGGGAGRLIGFQ